MKLQKAPFESIKKREKIIELRLYDEKRKSVKIGDIVEFSNIENLEEKIKTKVKGLLLYSNFRDLINDMPVIYFGFVEKDKQWLIESMYNIYKKEDEEKLGVLGIRIEVVD